MSKSNNKPRKKVAIIGAGPGGLSAGIALTQAGFDVKIFERHKEIKPLGGAIILNAIGINILRSYGIYADDLATTDTQRFRRYDGHQRVLQQFDKDLLNKANVSGWMAGLMRSDLYKRLLDKIQEEMIVTDHQFISYKEDADGVNILFEDGKSYTADLLVGADGVNSLVRKQLWGESELQHLGIAVWLGWSELEGPDRNEIVLNHSDLHQFGYSPLVYNEKNCFEWWFVEPCTEEQPEPSDPLKYISEKLRNFAYPVPEILMATNSQNLFRWLIKYRDPLSAWSKGRVTILGDAAHPTSPYAAYGAGMALEDGYFLGKYLAGVDLSNLNDLHDGLLKFDNQRVNYTNNVVGFAKTLGKLFHNSPKSLRILRDFLLDYTKFPERQIVKNSVLEAETLLKTVLDLEGKNPPQAMTGVAAYKNGKTINH
ncbi:FAD-dependent oxidoreductase [Metabacillus halosaccharovorans]|uniref:FAD-dependent oxidoreductase n=1 Tax=Metabacillus halosaccharovorans TaxID=930124 RepID=UPI0009959CB9|nr:NAD(P)/FAD-dependent oxidoreductase [Metabacillus halosaccharovorans]